MTDRIKVNAMDNDETKWPSWTAQGATTYAEAGVDTAEGARAVDAIKDAVHRTYRDEVRGDIGGFGGLFSINVAKNMADPILVSGTDGVGTKIQLAKLAGKHDTVGIDCVAMCVNDIICGGAAPLSEKTELFAAIGTYRIAHIFNKSQNRNVHHFRHIISLSYNKRHQILRGGHYDRAVDRY